jgi:hypothetical protein
MKPVLFQIKPTSICHAKNILSGYTLIINKRSYLAELTSILRFKAQFFRLLGHRVNVLVFDHFLYRADGTSVDLFCFLFQ